MFKFIKSFFDNQPKRLPGTVQEPMTADEAAAYWASMKRQSKETGGW